MYITGKIRAHT